MQTNAMILGTWQGALLRHAGPEHVLLFAPTRSGKGVGVVLPTLLSIGGSVVVHDVKGENWSFIAGWRSSMSHCVYFNPTHPQSIRLNPLLEVRKGVQEVKDVQNIADILVDPEGSLEKRDHWMLTSHGLLVATMLHILYAEPDKSLAGVAAFLSDPRRSFVETLWLMLRTAHLGARVHPVVASGTREALNKSPNELSGVLSTAMSFLGLYRDPLVARATSASDLRLTDLQRSPTPVSLYLVVPPSDLSRTRPLIRLLLNQMGRLLTEDWQTPPAQPLLLLLDEFPALGHLEFFHSALAYLAGYGIRALLVAQSLNQLDHVYGRDNAILDNCHLRITFAANDDRTAQRISALVGTATAIREQVSVSGKRWAAWLPHTSQTTVVSPRPLLTVDEVLQLPSDQALILRAGAPPIRAQKLRHYADPRFKDRVLPPPDLGILDVPPQTPSVWLREGPKPLLQEVA
jgi:type IV secretion system protein VirD4